MDLMRLTIEVPKIGHTGYYKGATDLIREIARADAGPLSVQPNAALARLVDSKTVYGASPEEMVAEVSNWINAGARIVGGCCGTNLAHYKAIVPIIRELNSKGK